MEERYVDYLAIIDGGHGGGYHNFHIVDAKKESEKGPYPLTDESMKDHFSINEDTIEDFLYPFFDKYITVEAFEKIARDDIRNFCGFEHYGWNYYSLKQIMDMAFDILRTSQLLKFEKLESTDPELYAYFIKKNKFNYNSDCTEDYRRNFVKTDLVDFFKRLSIRLRNMVGNAPEGYKYICIEGP